MRGNNENVLVVCHGFDYDCLLEKNLLKEDLKRPKIWNC